MSERQDPGTPASGRLGLRALLVEDHDDLAVLVARTLQARAGVACVRAKTRAEAESLMRGDRFDIVLLDHKLPDGEGLDLLPILRANAPETMVLFLTAHGSEDIAMRALGLGASDYMEKNARLLEELPTRVSRLLATAGDAAVAARVVAVRPRVTGAQSTLVEDPFVVPNLHALQALVEGFVGGDVIGVLILAEDGRHLAARLPPRHNADAFASAAFEICEQARAIEARTGLRTHASHHVFDSPDGTLAVSGLDGIVVAVLVAPARGEHVALKRLRELQDRVMG